MAFRQYIGARYVPAYFNNSATGDSTWAANTAYEALTMVTWNNNTYTSKKPVPANIGNPAENPEYWVVTSNVNAQVAELQEELGDIREDIEDLGDDIEEVSGDLNTLTGRVSTAETDIDNLESSVGTLQTTVSGHSASIGTLQTKTNTLETNVGNLEDDIGDINDAIDTIEGQIAGISASGWGTPDSFALPFTPTKDGFCMININPQSAGVSYLYIDEDNLEWCRGYSTAQAQQYTLSFPVRKNHTYSIHLSSNIGTPIYHYIPFA